MFDSEINYFDVINIFLVIYIFYFINKQINKNTYKNNINKKTDDKIPKKSEVLEEKTTKTDKNRDEIQELTTRYDNLLLKIENRDNIDEKLILRDLSVVQNPLVPPERRHNTEFNNLLRNRIKINEYTRGGPDNYQLVGLLYRSDIDKKINLFGRPVYPGSLEWEYYISGNDSGGMEYKFPLQINREIFDNTKILNPIDNNEYTVKIYELNKPRYIPL